MYLIEYREVGDGPDPHRHPYAISPSDSLVVNTARLAILTPWLPPSARCVRAWALLSESPSKRRMRSVK